MLFKGGLKAEKVKLRLLLGRVLELEKRLPTSLLKKERQ